MESLFGKLCGCFLLGALLWLPPATAAELEGAEATWEPPVLSGDDARIGLLDAVRLTIANDPRLLLKAEETRSQFGLYQERGGAFDWTFTGQAQWEHREQEVTEGTKRQQRDRRRQLDDAAALACPEADTLELKVQELEGIQLGGSAVSLTTDIGIQTQLLILERQITATDDAEQRRLLQEARDNLIATELDVTREAAVQVRRACTQTLDDRVLLGDIADEEEFDVGRLDLRLRKLDRRGVTWTPFVRGAFDSTNFIGKRQGFFVPSLDASGQPDISPSGIPLERLVDFGGKNVEDVYTAEVGFEINLPLLRNRGRDAVAASETSARIDWEASETLLKYSATESVLNTVLGYWQLVAAQEQVRIQERAVALQTRLTEITQALIEADELPGAEEARALAGLSTARTQLQTAARDLITARLDLARTIGLDVPAAENIPTASDDFPPPPAAAGIRPLEAELVQAARDNRLDIGATYRLADSGRVLARGALIGLKPKLDVTVSGWSIGRAEGSASEAIQAFAGPSWKLVADGEKPLGNNTAEGRLAQAEAQARRRQISAIDLDRQVSIAVVRTLHALAEAVQQLTHAEAAAAEFEKAVVTELEKLRLGETSLLDAILTEQQRTSAQLALLRARVQVATLAARVRFETGTMASSAEGDDAFSFESLTSLPATGADS